MDKIHLLLKTLFIFCCCCFLHAQDTQNGNFELKPYGGVNLPQGNFKDFANNGFNAGIALYKYFGKRFGLGLDLNYQSFGFSYQSTLETLPLNSVSQSAQNNWSTFSILAGPTYKIGSSKFNTEVYAKGGLLSITPPAQSATFSSDGNENLPLLSLNDDTITGFGLSTGIRLNYKISDRISLFVNPQYQFSGQQVEYFHRPITSQVIDNPNVLADDGGELCYIRPSTLGVNGGITISLGGKDEDKNSKIFPPFCNITFDVTSCNRGRQKLNFTSTWSGYASADTIDVKIYDGTTLIASGANITNNNRALGSNAGSLIHSVSFAANAYVGRNLIVVITIDDVNGVVVCTNQIQFTVPPCPPKPCDFVVDISNIICDATGSTFTTTSSWTNMTVGSIVDIVVYGPSGTIPVTFSPNNIPFTITASNVTGSLTHSVTISNAYAAQPLTIVMRITDPTTGQTYSCGGLDFVLPKCITPICNLEAEVRPCEYNDGTVELYLTSNWNNIPSTGTGTIELYDGSTLISPPINIPGSPFTLTPPSGRRGFGPIDVSDYEGQSITAKQTICWTNPDGMVECCEKLIDIEIPPCCFDCEGISITTNHNQNQKGDGFFKWYWNMSNISLNDIQHIVVTLESFGADDVTGTSILPSPNFEMIGVVPLSITPAGAPATASNRRIGSLADQRSNVIIVDFDNPITSADFYTIINVYDQKVLRNSRLRFMIYTADGKYCEKYIDYNN